MARRGGSIYVATDPNNVPLAIGTAGVSVSIGLLGPTIYGGSAPLPNQLVTEDTGQGLVTEDGQKIITES